MASVNTKDFGSIRPVTDSDLEMMLAWRNAPKVRGVSFNQHEISLEEHRAWWRSIKERKDQMYFIYELEGAPLGVVSLNSINTNHRNCFWGFYKASEAQRGVGLKMLYCALCYAFDTLKMNKVIGEVLSTNEVGMKLHRKLGFVEEGVFKDQYYLNNEFVSVHRLALFADRWQQVKADIEKGLREKMAGGNQ